MRYGRNISEFEPISGLGCVTPRAVDVVFVVFVVIIGGSGSSWCLVYCLFATVRSGGGYVSSWLLSIFVGLDGCIAQFFFSLLWREFK